MENKQFNPGDIVRWEESRMRIVLREDIKVEYNHGPFRVIKQTGLTITTEPIACLGFPTGRISANCFVLDKFLTAVEKVKNGKQTV